MRLLNRITVSLAVIFGLALVWEFWIKPNSSPLYTEAVGQYRDGNYARSLQLLRAAYRIDPNDTAILSLMGWDCLKLNQTVQAEAFFHRAYTLAPKVTDSLLGYAYTELALKKFSEAEELLEALRSQNVNTLDTHLAWATLYREMGKNREAVSEFQRVLAINSSDAVAIKNLDEIFDTTGDVGKLSTDLPPLIRPHDLTFTAHAAGNHFEWLANGGWQSVYLTGVDLTPVLPGHFPADSVADSAVYDDWLAKMTDLGANTVRVYTILPVAFYRSLANFNRGNSHPELRLLQGIPLGAPPGGDLFEHGYYEKCKKEIRDSIDAIHGQADLGRTDSHSGGVFTSDVSPWVAGLLLGQSWPSHVVTANNQLHPSMHEFRGTYLEAISASASEMFLAQMIDYAAEYEEKKYNWQHPVGFMNSPSLDPMHHPTESTVYEEIALRRARGERFETPAEPYDDDDAVTIDPMHLHALPRLAAGYFADYTVFPFYPDFIDREPAYRSARDAEGRDPFFGYVRDLKAHHRGVPLLISEYGIPTSLGVGHFGGEGFDQGGETEERQGRALARMTRNIFDAGVAGGMVFEWADEWYRQTWIVRGFEQPQERKPLWASVMDPAEGFGIVAARPRLSNVHTLMGSATDWRNISPLYAGSSSGPWRELGDRFDPAAHLKALYADADEGYLYLRLAVDHLDNDGDGEPDLGQVNYLIGISTWPKGAGLTSLPFIEPQQFPMGMTYAIQLAGKDASRIWIASSYNPYRLLPLDGAPGQTLLLPKLGWHPEVSSSGTFGPEVVEPNRRRFGRNGEYFPPHRYDRGILRYGSLDEKSPDYDSLAEWHANIQTNFIDLRIPWALLNVTDPSSLQILSGIDGQGKVETREAQGFMLAAFSYRPLDSAQAQPIMDQHQPVADSLPSMEEKHAGLIEGLKDYHWKGWNIPNYVMEPKESFALLRKAFLELRVKHAQNGNSPPQVAALSDSLSQGRSSHGSKRKPAKNSAIATERAAKEN